jgi:hypothetical protein
VFLSATRFTPADERFVHGSTLWDPGRPLLGPYVFAMFSVFGEHATWLLAWAAGLAAAVSTALLVLLRLVGVGRWAALAVAVLVLVTPWSDSTTLWAVGTQAHAAMLLLLLGAIWAVAALRRGAALAWHLPATLLYAAAILLYEVGGVLVLASFGLYRCVTGTRSAARRWAIDAVVALAALVYNLTHTQKADAGHSLSAYVSRAGDVAREGLRTAALALSPERSLGIVGIAVLLAAAGVAVAALRRPALRSGAALIVAGAAVTALSWAVLVPAFGYLPSQEYLGNRINALAVVGLALVAVGLAVAVAALPPRRSVGVVIGVLAVVVLGARYGADLRDHERLWVQAARERRHAIDTVDALVGDRLRGPGAHVAIVEGVPPMLVNGVTVLGGLDDLGAALRVRSDNAAVGALLRTPWLRWTCEPDEAVAVGIMNGSVEELSFAAPYADAVLVDVPGRHAWPIDAASCRSRLRAAPA